MQVEEEGGESVGDFSFYGFYYRTYIIYIHIMFYCVKINIYIYIYNANILSLIQAIVIF